MEIPVAQDKLTGLPQRPVLDDITIVIPTLGRSILEDSLSWIARGRAWPGALIVVDQGRKPEVAALIQRLRGLGMEAHYLPSSQRGRSAGVNRGLEQVRTRFVAVTDDDCFVEPGWLANMAERLRAHPDAIITGRVEAAGDGTALVVTSTTPAVYTRPRLKFDAMSGGNMGTSMDVIRRVGMLDEDPRLRTAEDAEFSYRALRGGVPIFYAPEVGVQHYGWRDGTARAGQYRDYARSHGGFYGKYIRKGDLFILARAFLHHGRALRRYVRGKIAGDRDLADIGHAYLTGLLPGIVQGFRANAQGAADR